MGFYSIIDRFLFFPIGETLLGRNVSHVLSELKKTEWLTEEDIYELQSKKLRQLVKHCYENVPYYRHVFERLHLKPDDIRTRDDLQKLPILTKQIINDHFDELVSRDIRDRDYVNGSTGGSTGTPMKFKEDVNSWNALKALNFRGWSWAGFHVGEKMFTLAGNSLVKKKTKSSKWVIKYLFDRVIMRNEKHDCTDITQEALKKYYSSLMRYKPVAIRGYASSLYFLASYIEQENLPICPVRVVFTTGEKLFPKYRLKLQKVFHAPVFDGYGASDGGVSAHECYMHEGMHLEEEHCIVEIVDKEGRVLPEGEIGSVISTDLNNYVFPFLRYKVGDLAYIKKERCSCGRKHRLLGEVIGREGRAIFNKHGRPYSSIVIDNMMFKDLDIHSEDSQMLYRRMERFQIRQDKRGDISVLIKPVNHEEPMSTFSYIVDNFRLFFPDSKVEMRFVEDIPPLPSGKDDYCISEFQYQN